MTWISVRKGKDKQRKIVHKKMVTKALRSWKWMRMKGFSSKTTTQNTLLRRPSNGLKTTIFNFLIGLFNPLTLIPLNTFGIISSPNFRNMTLQLKECMSCGIG
jgi:hypothetical protein